MAHVEYFEIFTVKADGDTKSAAIDTLFDLPDEDKGTERYRTLKKQYEGDQWAGAVGDDLIGACSEMSDEQRAVYYDDSDLKTIQWLRDNDWFAPGPP